MRVFIFTQLSLCIEVKCFGSRHAEHFLTLFEKFPELVNPVLADDIALSELTNLLTGCFR